MMQAGQAPPLQRKRRYTIVGLYLFCVAALGAVTAMIIRVRDMEEKEKEQ